METRHSNHRFIHAAGFCIAFACGVTCIYALWHDVPRDAAGLRQAVFAIVLLNALATGCFALKMVRRAPGRRQAFGPAVFH